MGGGVRIKGPALKYGTEVEVIGVDAKEYFCLKYNFYEKQITGGTKILKDHLACTKVNFGGCKKVLDEVKNECVEYSKKYVIAKEIAQKIRRR